MLSVYSHPLTFPKFPPTKSWSFRASSLRERERERDWSLIDHSWLISILTYSHLGERLVNKMVNLCSASAYLGRLTLLSQIYTCVDPDPSLSYPNWVVLVLVDLTSVRLSRRTFLQFGYNGVAIWCRVVLGWRNPDLIYACLIYTCVDPDPSLPYPAKLRWSQ